MAKDSRPKSGPVGNTDDTKRGRGVSGRPSDGQPQSPATSSDKPARSTDDPDTDGYSVGGR